MPVHRAPARPALGGEISGASIKAARVLAGLTIADLAQLTGLGTATLGRAEACGSATTALTKSNSQRVIDAFHAANVTILFAEDRGIGVWLSTDRPQRKA